MLLIAADGNKKNCNVEKAEIIHRPGKGGEYLRIAITKVMTKSPQVLLLSVHI